MMLRPISPAGRQDPSKAGNAFFPDPRALEVTRRSVGLVLDLPPPIIQSLALVHPGPWARNRGPFVAQRPVCLQRGIRKRCHVAEIIDLIAVIEGRADQCGVFCKLQLGPWHDADHGKAEATSALGSLDLRLDLGALEYFVAQFDFSDLGQRQGSLDALRSDPKEFTSLTDTMIAEGIVKFALDDGAV